MQIIDNHIEDFSLYNYTGYHRLSDKAKELLLEWNTDKKEIKRANWSDIFLAAAFNIAERSPDGRTKCGAILVNEYNEIIAEGFNGVIRGVDEKFFPNYNGLKYPFFIHAEHNAVLNCARQGKSTIGSICYCTGKPCFNCMQVLWQASVKRVVYPRNIDNEAKMTKTDENYKAQVELFMWMTQGNFEILEVDVDFSHLEKIVNRYKGE